MKSVFETFLTEMVNDVPFYVYEVLFFSFCLAAVIAIVFLGWNKGRRILSRFALFEYIGLIYCSTVLFRTSKDKYEYHSTPFWSYFAYDSVNRPDLLPENIMNVVVFIPLGILLGLAFRKFHWWQVMLMGFGISFSIEALQYYFKLGISEFDDVMHNTLGCLMGYGIYSLIHRTHEKFSKRRVVVL